FGRPGGCSPLTHLREGVDQSPQLDEQWWTNVDGHLAEMHHDKIPARHYAGVLPFIAVGGEAARLIGPDPPVRAVPEVGRFRICRDLGARVLGPAGGQQLQSLPRSVAEVEQTEAGEVAGRRIEV